MFTGIITDIGTVAARDGGRFTIRCGYPAAGIALGASIACDGACLTATAVEPAGAGSIFTVDVSNETLSKTTLGEWHVGRRINLERALKAGDELGGHMVSGPRRRRRPHRRDPRRTAHSRRFTIEAPADLARYIAPKGSVALDGISLTVNEVDGARFGINIIPHTLTHTTLGDKKPGDAGEPGSRSVRALRGEGLGVSAVKDGLKRVEYAEGKGFLSPIDEIIEDLRNGRMIILVDAEDRENEGDLVVPGADGDARCHQLHGQARARPGLPVADPAARRPAAPRVHGAPERGAQPHGLHGFDRGARGHRHRHLRARPRPHHRHRHRPHQGPARTSSRPATCFR